MRHVTSRVSIGFFKGGWHGHFFAHHRITHTNTLIGRLFVVSFYFFTLRVAWLRQPTLKEYQ